MPLKTGFEDAPRTRHEWAVEHEAQRQHTEECEAIDDYYAEVERRLGWGAWRRAAALWELVWHARRESVIGPATCVDPDVFLRFYRNRYLTPLAVPPCPTYPSAWPIVVTNVYEEMQTNG